LRLVLKKFGIGVVTAEVQWSELQRDPKAVAALADPLLLAALSREVDGDLGPVGVPEPV
jgi:hypothetical protein